MVTIMYRSVIKSVVGIIKVLDMYYALADDVQLLCWRKQLTGVLLNVESEKMQTVSYSIFRLLIHADGQTDYANLTTADDYACLEQLVDDGLLINSTHPIKPHKDWFRIYDNRCVISTMWSLTGCCNYQCRHCLMDAPNGLLGEANTDDMLSLVDEMADAGIHYIDLTGGEPLLRKDFPLLIDKLSSREIKIKSISTNGALINQAFFDNLRKNGQNPRLQISFDGVEGWHNWMRGNEDAEQDFVSAVQLCQQNDISVTVALCLHKGNFKALSATIQTLKQHGVNNFDFSGITHSKRWDVFSEGYQMTNQEYLDACLEYIDEYYSEGCPINLSIGGIAYFEEKTGKYRLYHNDAMDGELSDYVCTELRTSCYITPDLRLLPCIGMTASDAVFDYPTIKQCGGFKQALDQSLYLRTTTTTICDFLKHNAECSDCEYRIVCHGGCRACAMAEKNGDFWAKDTMNCYFWKNGYREKIERKVMTAFENYQMRVLRASDSL